MEDCYEVYYGKRPAGKVYLLKKGLYCHVRCYCQVPKDQVLRLYAQWDDRRENLGVLVPEGDGFLLNKMIPVKRLGHGKVQFLLSSGAGISCSGSFEPINPEEPFRYIDRLKNSFLESEHGKIGIRVQQHPEAV